MMDLYLGIVNFDPTYLLYMSKDAWAYLVDHVFSHEFSPLYHQIFLRLLLKVIELKDENLYVTVIIC